MAYSDSEEAQKISERLAQQYGLIPIQVQQDQMLDYVRAHPERNYLSDVAQLKGFVNTAKPGGIATMSICSYMNPYTPNKRLAIVHSTGTGKTRKALLAALSYDRDITIVAVHNVQVTPFLDEMASSPEIRALYPGFRKRLEPITCKSVSDAWFEEDYARLDFYFKDRVIIIDEVHHVKNSGEKPRSKKKTPLFDSVIGVLSRYRNCITLLLTATPLVDSASEMFGIYKLLKGIDPPESSPTHIAALLKGYVSRLVSRNLESETHIVKCKMMADGEQYELYQRYKDDKSSVYSKQEAIARFVTLPDDMASACPDSIVTLIQRMVAGMHFETDRDRDNASIEALKYLSVKMYNFVKFLQNPANRGSTKFVYDRWKERGGMERLAEVLAMPAIGYVSVKSEADVTNNPDKPKMLVLHQLSKYRGSTGLDVRLRKIFNSPENADGSLIELMLATPKYSESMSLSNTTSSHDFSVEWNETASIQIRGRINRKNSLRHLPRELRKVHHYNYVLFEPDGAETFESDIIRRSREKYEGVKMPLAVLEQNKIENYYSANTQASYFKRSDFSTYMGVNCRVRLCSHPVSYRDLILDITPFLDGLEKYPNISSLMHGIAGNGKNRRIRLLNVAIFSMEAIYISRVKGDKITEKQAQALIAVEKAFFVIADKHYHALYFSSSDTVEYQRFSSVDKRVLRMLNADLSMWEDVQDPDLSTRVYQMYEKHRSDFVDTIHARWVNIGFYATFYVLTSSYRLVGYRDKKYTARQSSHQDQDLRKLSRGEKPQSYSKEVLANLLIGLHNPKLELDQKLELTPTQKIQRAMQIKEITKMCSLDNLSTQILKLLTTQNMLLVLPI